MATDVEIERSLNALNVTLNDQRLDRMHLDRLQEIVTGALGGRPHLKLVHDAELMGRIAWLHDHADQIVGRVELRPGPQWIVQRYGQPQAGGPTPSS